MYTIEVFNVSNDATLQLMIRYVINWSWSNVMYRVDCGLQLYYKIVISVPMNSICQNYITYGKRHFTLRCGRTSIPDKCKRLK